MGDIKDGQPSFWLARDYPSSSQMRGAWSRAPPDDPLIFENTKVLFQLASIPTTYSKTSKPAEPLFPDVMMNKRRVMMKLMKSMSDSWVY